MAKRKQKRNAVEGITREIPYIRRTHPLVDGSEDGKNVHTNVKECGQPLDTGNEARLRTSKDTGPQSYNQKCVNSANNLSEPGWGFFPRATRKENRPEAL